MLTAGPMLRINNQRKGLSCCSSTSCLHPYLQGNIFGGQ